MTEEIATPQPSPLQDKTLASRIARLMSEQGYNQTTFAAKVGIERTELNRSLGGKRQFRPQELGWIAQALGTGVEELLSGLELPLALQKTRDELQDLTRRVLEAESERDRAQAELTAVGEDFAAERAQWQRERSDLAGANTRLRTEHEREMAQVRRTTAERERELGAALEQARDERDRAQSAQLTNHRAAQAMHLQLRQAQETLAGERSKKVATGVLAGLAGVLLGGALSGSDDRDAD